MTTQILLLIRFGSQQFLHWFLVGILLPILVLMFTERGLSLSEIGWIMGVWAATTALLEVPLGALSDKWDRRAIYLLSAALNTVGYLCLMMFSEFHIIVFAAIILGAARAMYSGTIDALFYECWQKSEGDVNSHQALAYLSISQTVGLALGSLSAGLLPKLSSLSLVTSAYSTHLSVIKTGFFLMIPLTILLIPSNTKTSQCKAQNLNSLDDESRFEFSLQLRLKRLFAITLLFGLTLSVVENNWQLLVDNYLTQTESLMIFGLVSFTFFAADALSSWLATRAANLFQGDHERLIWVTRLIAGITLIVITFVEHLALFWFVYFLFILVFMLGNTSHSLLINQSVEDKNRAKALSLDSVFFTSGGVAASIGFGYISESFSPHMSWVICGLLLTIGTLLLRSQNTRSAFAKSTH